MGIYSMGLTMCLLKFMTVTMTMAIIAMDLVDTTLNLGPGILGIWITPALLSELAKFATVLASGS